MEISPINQTFADNLAHYMAQRGYTQMALSKLSGIGQTTISLYLNPERRKSGKAAKPGSAKLVEVEMLATALDVEPWELLRPFNDAQRSVYARIEAAYKELLKESGVPTVKPEALAAANQVAEKPKKRTANKSTSVLST